MLLVTSRLPHLPGVTEITVSESRLIHVRTQAALRVRRANKTEYKQKKCTRAERAFRAERTFVATPVATTVQITEGEALERNACSETSTPA
ncbi:hypothetical protein NDU88_005023 [Pleurodeles waltl]|uniref:Uncharacterized protein n=1 Tax=Pleurodeles waltl TaxID=8319 RepID=A0AAV7SKG6_PLEWA|nr:hypothetical protein NDU88_005023 [Pleurodeles waltl]